MAVTGRARSERHQSSSERGATLVEVAVATVLLAASAAIVGAGVQTVIVLGSQVAVTDGLRHAAETAMAQWPAGDISLCAAGQMTVADAAPTGFAFDHQPMIWAADGTWAELEIFDCAEIAEAGLMGPTVLRWTVSLADVGPVQIVTRARWP